MRDIYHESKLLRTRSCNNLPANTNIITQNVDEKTKACYANKE